MSAAAFWASAVAGAAAALVVGELADVSAWVAPKVIRSASSRMPTPELQERYREEWLAELDALDGLKLIKLAKALNLWVSSWRMRRALCDEVGRSELIPAVRRLVSAIPGVAKTAWRGQISRKPLKMGDEIISKPHDVALVLFSLMLVVAPTNYPMNVIVKFNGHKFKTAIAPQTDVNRHASWLIPTARILAVAFFDMYLLRSGTPLREIRKYHVNARHAISKGDPQMIDPSGPQRVEPSNP